MAQNNIKRSNKLNIDKLCCCPTSIKALWNVDVSGILFSWCRRDLGRERERERDGAESRVVGVAVVLHATVRVFIATVTMTATGNSDSEGRKMTAIVCQRRTEINTKIGTIEYYS